MGILTTQDSARSFSSYVAVFGLALLISSIIYLKRLDNSTELLSCDYSSLMQSTADFPTCSQIGFWRSAAIVGIVLGVIDTLIMPFIFCCICFTAVCGCALCVTYGCAGLCSDDSNQKRTNSSKNEDTEATTINIEHEDRTRSTNKYEVHNEPSKLHFWLNSLGWVLLVLGPFLATLYITIALYKYDAIRTRSDELFNSALALYIIALFNLMVYFQKFMNSICGYGHEKIAETQKQ